MAEDQVEEPPEEVLCSSVFFRFLAFTPPSPTSFLRPGLTTFLSPSYDPLTASVFLGLFYLRLSSAYLFIRVCVSLSSVSQSRISFSIMSLSRSSCQRFKDSSVVGVIAAFFY